MEINKHIFFGKDKAPELVEYLQQNGIPYKDTNGLIIFDILQSDQHWRTVCGIVENRKISYLSETLFSKQELSDASWLTVRSQWRNGYPQPESNFAYQRITYSTDHYCNECGSGLQQVDSFRMKSAPKWGNKHFMMLNWVYDELFLDDAAKNMLIENGFTGFHFSNVHSKNGKSVLSGVHQLVIDSKSNPGFIEGNPDVRNIVMCPVCGIQKYHPSGIGMHSFRKDALLDMPDICKTYEVFGWRKSSDHLILVRQNVYRSIMDNRLDRGLVFSPVELI